MVITIAIIAAVTSLLITLMVCSALTVRPKTPCMFQAAFVYVGEARIGDGHRCTGKVDNIYMSADPARSRLNDWRVCDRHVGHLLDVSDQLAKQ